MKKEGPKFSEAHQAAGEADREMTSMKGCILRSGCTGQTIFPVRFSSGHCLFSCHRHHPALVNRSYNSLFPNPLLFEVNTVMQDFGEISVPSSLNPSRAVTHPRARVSFLVTTNLVYGAVVMSRGFSCLARGQRGTGSNGTLKVCVSDSASSYKKQCSL